MDLEELQSVRDRERQTDQLQQLRESFYEDAGAFVADLRAERDRVAERVDDPYAPEATRLNNEIETAIQLVEDIQERRIGKIVKAGSLDAAGLPANVEGMTAEEQDLFDTLVQDIRAHRDRVLGIVEDEETTVSQDSKAENADAESEREHPAALQDPVPAAEGGTESESTAAPPREDGPASDEPQETPAPDAEAGAPERSITSETEARDGNLPSSGDDGPATGDAAAEAMGGSTTTTPSSSEVDSGMENPTRADGPDVATGESHSDSQAGGETSPAPSAKDEAIDRANSEEPTEESAESHRSADTGEPAATTGSPATERVDRTTVLVTEEVDTFVGFDDCDYDLEPTDVVALPTPNADILVNKGVARRLSAE